MKKKYFTLNIFNKQKFLLLIFTFLISVILSAESITPTANKDFPTTFSVSKNDNISEDFKNLTKQIIQNAFLENYGEVLRTYLILNSESSLDKFEFKISESEALYLKDNVLILFTRVYRNGSSSLYLNKKLIKNLDDIISKSQVCEEEQYNEYLLAKNIEKNWVFNLSANIFNTISKTFSQLVTGNIHVILQVAFDSVYNIYTFNRFSEKDNERLALYKAYQKRNPKSSKIEDKQDKIDSLQRDKDKYLVRKFINRGKMLRRSEDYYLAEFFISKADEVGKNKYKKNKIDSLDLKIAKEESKNRRERSESLDFIYPTEDSKLSSSEKESYKILLDTILSSNSDDIIKACSDFKEKNKYISLANEADYEKIVGYRDIGEMSAVKSYLENMKKNNRDKSIREKADIALENPYFDSFGQFEKQQANRKSETIIYCLTGYRSTEEGAKLTITALLNSPENIAQTLGSFLVIEIVLRTGMLPLVNPVSDQSVIDAAKFAIDQESDDKNREKLTQYLYERYKKRKEFDKSLSYLKQSEEYSEKKENKLRKKWAKYEKEMAEQVKLPENKIKHLKKTIEVCPDSKIAKKAQAEIDKLEKITGVTMWISWGILKKYKNESLLTYLGISENLLDKKKRNGEIDEKGIGIKKDNTIVYYDLKTKDYQIKKINIDDIEHEKLVGLLLNIKKEDELSASYADFKKKEYFPMEVQGSLGEGGLVAYPQIRTDEE